MAVVWWAGLCLLSLWLRLLDETGWRIGACPMLGVVDGGASRRSWAKETSWTRPFTSRTPSCPIISRTHPSHISRTPSYPVFPITPSLTPSRSWLSAEVCCLFSCLWVRHRSPTRMLWPHLHAVSRAVCGMRLGAWLIWHLVAGARYELAFGHQCIKR